MESDKLREKINSFEWYHTINLGKGVITPGRSTSLGYKAVEKLIKRINVKKCNCLDIGTMDGIIAFQLEKKKAKDVVATCLNDRPSFRFLKEYMDSKIKYFPRVSLDTIENVKASGIEKFDLVVLAGVLYHLLDPLHGIAIVRNLLRNGGIAIFETSIADFDDEDFNSQIALHFNFDGRFLAGFENMWMPTKACLHYMLSYCCFNILDEEIIMEGTSPRYAVAAKAVRPSEIETNDYWLKLVHEIGGNYAPLVPETYQNDIDTSHIFMKDKFRKNRAKFPGASDNKRRTIENMMRKSYEFLTAVKKASNSGIQKAAFYTRVEESGFANPVLARLFRITRSMKIVYYVVLNDVTFSHRYGIPVAGLNTLIEMGMPIITIKQDRQDLLQAGIPETQIITT